MLRDRGYTDEGALVPRGAPGDVIHGLDAVRAQVRRLAGDGRFDTVCVHGDGADALAVAEAVREALGCAVTAMGEGAWRVSLPDGSDPVAVLDALRALPGVDDVVVADAQALVCGETMPPGLVAAVTGAARAERERREWTLPVRYDGDDLEAVAAALECDVDAVVRAHTARPWEVLRMGFLPGFAYLGPLPSTLMVPRRATPRTAGARGEPWPSPGRARGSIPFASPGGGTSSVARWTSRSSTPSGDLAGRVGDRVRFEAA